ncbi:MAG: hypothetical protein LBT56_07125 [Prevotellaceae bacterium]|nr:hypothetical protein [Prevotellaceae bacterium]
MRYQINKSAKTDLQFTTKKNSYNVHSVQVFLLQSLLFRCLNMILWGWLNFFRVFFDGWLFQHLSKYLNYNLFAWCFGDKYLFFRVPNCRLRVQISRVPFRLW